jgi:hypothetical protein
MADPQPSKEILENLQLLIDMELLQDEKDWNVIKSLDHADRMNRTDRAKPAKEANDEK